MTSRVLRPRWLLAAGAALLLLAAVQGQPPTTQPPKPAEKFVPKFEVVAETRLLMEALNQANFRALEGMLKQKPDAVDAWTFARGQAILIAETGNLLLLRPPRNQGRDTWQMRATEMRDSATALAKVLARSDFEGSRAALVQLGNACNRCHQTFQVPVRIAPFKQGEQR
jgi:hypothetical protein